MKAPSNSWHTTVDLLWDCACCASLIGIWPRFIEPRLLKVTELSLSIAKLPPALQGLKIVQFSDLHLHPTVSESFTQKISARIASLKPDLIVFTGDLLCFAELSPKERLKSFLNSFHAPYGCYAILGNHDYAQAVSFNEEGDYDLLERKPSAVARGLKRLFFELKPTGKISESARAVKLNEGLLSLLKETPFLLLHNQTLLLPIKESFLNVCGLGEYMLGDCRPDIAFQKYDDRYPGVILAHNPDSVPLLSTYPGSIILSGHTHGGQINLPWIWKKFTLLENLQYTQGLFRVDSKWLYVSRGVGSVIPFRWFSSPELVQITLEAT